MALLERCTNLRERIDRHDALRRAHKEAEGFRERANALEEVHRELAAALGRMRVLRLRGVEISKTPDPAGAAAALRTYEIALAEGSTESGKHYSRLKRSIDKVTRDVVTAVEKALESMKRDLPTIEEAFLKQVERIPAYAAQVSRIRRERDTLLAGSEPTRMSPEELAAFLDRRDELRKLANQLSPTEFPQEVLDFFKAARQAGGAPLEKLTETVRIWLQERDLLQNVRVTVVAR